MPSDPGEKSLDMAALRFAVDVADIYSHNGSAEQLHAVAKKHLASARSGGEGWIACSDRMPEVGVYVLMWDGDDAAIGYWERGPQGFDWWLSDGSGWDTTHWMPLPDPPARAGTEGT